MNMLAPMHSLLKGEGGKEWGKMAVHLGFYHNCFIYHEKLNSFTPNLSFHYSF
jgi:hypothetical protein